MAEAKTALYASVEESLTGRAVALSNQTEDRSPAYLVIVSISSSTITADIITFIDNKSKNSQPSSLTSSCLPTLTHKTRGARADAYSALYLNLLAALTALASTLTWKNTSVPFSTEECFFTRRDPAIEPSRILR
jgi:hypothetical protein